MYLLAKHLTENPLNVLLHDLFPLPPLKETKKRKRKSLQQYSPTLNICKQYFVHRGSYRQLFLTKHCQYYAHHRSILRKSNQK